MIIKPCERVVKLAKTPEANALLLNFILSAGSTVQSDDLTVEDAWENLIHDLESALELATAIAENVRKSCRVGS